MVREPVRRICWLPRGSRKDGNKCHLCDCGCGWITANGYLFRKGHSPEEKALAETKRVIKELKEMLYKRTYNMRQNAYNRARKEKNADRTKTL